MTDRNAFDFYVTDGMLDGTPPYALKNLLQMVVSKVCTCPPVAYLPNNVWNAIAQELRNEGTIDKRMVGRELRFGDVIIRPEEDR